jgi:AraC-like DNA-binding protein
MPKVIQNAWMNRLLNAPCWEQMCGDFRELTGMEVAWLSSDAHFKTPPGWISSCTLANWIYNSARGQRYYQRLWVDLCETQPEEPVEKVCDAGLMHLIVPLWCSGSWVGNLFVSGYRVGMYDLATRNRLRHFIDRLGLVENEQHTHALADGVRCVRPAFHHALRNRLQDVTVSLRHFLEVRSADNSKHALPAVVAKVCQWIQRNFDQPLTLKQAAAVAGMNESYFSRLFSLSTGLHFIDYVNEIRLNEARHRLLDAQQSIAEIAFASGFGSLSQFNRVFVRSSGCNPRSWRKQSQRADYSIAGIDR